MVDFAHVLRRAEGRLEVPEPQRSRILLEIAQDLEGAYRSHRAQGCSDAEARARAEAAFDASDASLDTLGELHTPRYARLLARFSEGDSHRGERLLLSGITLFAVISGVYTLVAAGLMRSPSPFVWPLLALVALSACVIGWAVIRLYLHAYRPPAAADLVPVLGLAGISLALGVLAVLIETWRLAERIEAAATANVTVVLPYLTRASGLLTLSITLSLAILLAWLHLRQRAGAIERLRRAVSRVTQPSNRTIDR